MDRFCGKCGARLDERTGLCPVCDPTADIINTVRSRAEEETVVPESDPVRQTAAPQPQGQPVRRMAYCARCGTALDAWGTLSCLRLDGGAVGAADRGADGKRRRSGHAA